MSLNCSLPDNTHLWSNPAFTGFLGAIIGAGIGFVAQFLLAKKQEQMARDKIEADRVLKEAEFKRTDQGIHRQLRALVSQVGTWVTALRQYGLIGDFNLLRASLSQLNERIYKWEVSTALTDEQAEGLYTVSEMVGLAYEFVLRSKLDVNLAGDDREKRDGAITGNKGTFKLSCGALAQFWLAMEDEKRARFFGALFEQQDGEQFDDGLDVPQFRLPSKE
jgi:gas vesicle protein